MWEGKRAFFNLNAPVASSLIKPPQFWFLMKPENADIALAMARIAVKIRRQKCKTWVVKDLGIEI